MDPIRNYDSRKADLVYSTGPRMGTAIEFEQGRAVIDELALVEDRAGVYLLRALTDQPIEVSGELLSEKVLQWGDRIVIGSTRLELRERESDSALADAARAQRLFQRLLLALALTIVLLMGLDRLLGLENGSPDEKAAAAQTEPPGPARPRSGISDAERIAASRLAFAAAERFQAEAQSVESYQFEAVRMFQAVVRELEGIEPTPLIAKVAGERLETALDQLRRKLEYLRNNAYVAHSVSEDDDLRSILEEIMATIPDPANEEYWQWARDKIIQMEAK